MGGLARCDWPGRVSLSLDLSASSSPQSLTIVDCRHCSEPATDARRTTTNVFAIRDRIDSESSELIVNPFDYYESVVVCFALNSVCCGVSADGDGEALTRQLRAANVDLELHQRASGHFMR